MMQCAFSLRKRLYLLIRLHWFMCKEKNTNLKKKHKLPYIPQALNIPPKPKFNMSFMKMKRKKARLKTMFEDSLANI